QVQASESAVEMARLDLEYTAILSPIDGRTGRRLVDVGNVVGPSDGRPLLSIQRLDPIYAELTIAESELPRLRASVARGPVTVELRPVELGQRQDDLVVAGGLAAGEKVVTAGQMMLYPGARVDATDEAASPSPKTEGARRE